MLSFNTSSTIPYILNNRQNVKGQKRSYLFLPKCHLWSPDGFVNYTSQAIIWSKNCIGTHCHGHAEGHLDYILSFDTQHDILWTMFKGQWPLIPHNYICPTPNPAHFVGKCWHPYLPISVEIRLDNNFSTDKT